MTINIGVIGTGAIGADHARRISKTLIGGKIVAVNDVNISQAQSLVDELGLSATIHNSGHDLIHDDGVDAVLVTSWGPTHEEFVVAAINAGKYVFCEKPLATSAQGCRNIIEAEMQAQKRLVQVGFMRPYDSGYLQLKNAIDSGLIGEPLIVHCAHRNPSVPDTYHTPMAIHDTLIHELDVLRWLLNDEFVSAQVVFPRKTKYAHSALADPQIILLETKKGVRIDVEVFVNCQYGYDIQCSVVGEEGVANLPEPQSLLLRKEAKLSNDILMDWKDRFIAAYDVELQAFINGISNNKLTGPSAWDGMAASIASDACVKAQQSQQIEPITMPEQPAFYR
ncbi:Gfo/Idh/MocA family oxidoreductase [Neptunomonas sp. CHC150]|uniref:Gfo/Idh/MocA family oxidoreductase n=1 Tax=Neptunomonas sp. CHC150 TaxID=2998324 RepID=UPI0025B074C2|nr:Gfo/Idh/MocA family oxidoreductase [Neptunomonas sp. CHC150]MDN2659536.1 Gfo/Idh/MocA family oxidoreductase [Neptunomonas sp. CHC150]